MEPTYAILRRGGMTSVLATTHDKAIAVATVALANELLKDELLALDSIESVEVPHLTAAPTPVEVLKAALTIRHDRRLPDRIEPTETVTVASYDKLAVSETCAIRDAFDGDRFAYVSTSAGRDRFDELAAVVLRELAAGVTTFG